MNKIGGLIMKLSLATTGLATMCCLTTACGKEADLTPIDTSAVPNTTSSIVTTAPITTTAPIVTSTQQMSVDIPLTDEIIIDTTIDDDIIIETYPSEEKVTTEIEVTESENVSRDTSTTTAGTTTTKKPTVTTTTTKKATTTTTTTKKKTTTTTTTKKKTTTTTTTTAKKQEITTTTSPVIKITQSDVDKLVNELQEYSNSKSVWKEDYVESIFYGVNFNTYEEYCAYRVANRTPDNSSWHTVISWSEYQTNTEKTFDEIYSDKIAQIKECLDLEYEILPNSHQVVYAEYTTNSYTGDTKWSIYLLY